MLTTVVPWCLWGFQDPCECQNSQMPTSFIYCTFIWYSTVSLPFLQVLHLWIQRIDWIYLFHMHYPHGVIFLPWWLISKEPTYQCRKCWFDPWVPSFPGEGNGNPFQCSCLGNPWDRGTWQAIIHGITKSQTWLSNWKTTAFLTLLWTIEGNDSALKPVGA